MVGGGGSGSGEGRLAQEDVEELEQGRQDHGPRRQLTAAGSGIGSGWLPGYLRLCEPTPRLCFVPLRRRGGQSEEAAWEA